MHLELLIDAWRDCQAEQAELHAKFSPHEATEAEWAQQDQQMAHLDAEEKRLDGCVRALQKLM